MNRVKTKWISMGIVAILVACAPSKDPKRIEEANIRFKLAQQLLAQDETTQAMSELLKAEALTPKDPEIQNALGLILVQLGKMEEGELHLRKSVKLDPTFSEAHNHLCALLIQQKKYDEAIAQCTKAAENISYTTPERAYQNMGFAYYRKGDTSKAIDSYRKGLIHNPNFVLTRKSLADLYTEMGKSDLARTELEAAAKVCDATPKGQWGRECPATFYDLAMMYVKQKQRVKAAQALRSCVSSDASGGEYGEKCQSHLQILK